VHARVAKLVDAPSSGGGAARCAGSNPVPGTIKSSEFSELFILFLFFDGIIPPLHYLLFWPEVFYREKNHFFVMAKKVDVQEQH
jgi:hypothetical protein